MGQNLSHRGTRVFIRTQILRVEREKAKKGHFSGRMCLPLRIFVPKLGVSFRRHHKDRAKPDVALAPASQERDGAMRLLVKLMARQAAREYLRAINDVTGVKS